MTTIFIENIIGSGQVIKVLEDFGGSTVEHILRPGENTRIVVSPFKSVTIDEVAAGTEASRPIPYIERRSVVAQRVR